MTTPSSSPARFAYRPDIDGLRAIAVLAVVIFHLGFESIEGGFLGVDVFFVISGFLITSIIAPKMAAGTFSFKDFYLGRIRRLIPPALVTVVLTFIAAAFILDPIDMIAMAKSAIASVFSVSNILFFTEAGYWDAQSDLKPLLHTWSLGVEEQFYLVWPLLVFFFLKSMPKVNLFWAFSVATIIGLIISEMMLRANPSAAFFLLPARFFEFSIGAAFAFLGKTEAWDRLGGFALRSVLGLIALAVLLATIWIYKGDTPFPGLNGILPCLATAVLLLSGSGRGGATPLNLLLSSKVMIWLGQVSYSLYLVHWPVVSLMRYKVGLELELHHQIIAILMTAALTVFLYYGVEKRYSSRSGQGASKRQIKKGAKREPKTRLSNGQFAARTAAATVAVSAIFAHAALTDGWAWRFPDLLLTPDVLKAEEDRNTEIVRSTCFVDDYWTSEFCDKNKPLQVLIFGDSHERTGFDFLDAGFGSNPDLQLIRFGQTNSCEIKRVERQKWIMTNEDCLSRVQSMLDPKFSKNIDVFIYSANKPFSFPTMPLLNTVRGFREAAPHAKVIMLGPYIITNTECSRLINQTGRSEACITPENAVVYKDGEYGTILKPQYMELMDDIIDKFELHCDADIPESCEYKTPSGFPFMLDTNHQTYEFSRYSGEKFALKNPDYFQDLIAEE